jgi:hypothetical protein
MVMMLWTEKTGWKSLNGIIPRNLQSSATKNIGVQVKILAPTAIDLSTFKDSQ